jgi:hypothetical protein
VAHLDGSRTNAAATNLKWVSHVENHSHRQRHGTDPAGERHPSAKLSEADARAILASDEPHGQIAERFNVSPHTVSDIKRGKRWGHIQSHCAAFTPAPWTPHGNGWEVRAMDGQMKVCDIRGWGYLTGKGARALPDDEAVAIQKANENVCDARVHPYAPNARCERCEKPCQVCGGDLAHCQHPLGEAALRAGIVRDLIFTMGRVARG